MCSCARASPGYSRRPASTWSHERAPPTISCAGAGPSPGPARGDINMPPGHGDDGLRAAIEVRRQRPETGVLVLSQYYEERYAADLLADGADGVGYLLKERVGRVQEFVDAAVRVAE